MLKLYDSPECPFCQKTRIVLAEKDLSYELVPVDLQAGEQKRPEFIKLNPFGKVPVLIDDEVIVYDSTIINEYLEDEYPHPQLMPSDSAARARVRTFEDYADNAFIPLTGTIMRELRKPEAERDQEKLTTSRQQVARMLAVIDGSLAGRNWLVGNFSLADVAFAPRIVILPALGVTVDPEWRNLASWIQRLNQRASVHDLTGLSAWRAA
ncbi:MAG: glutathione S-transferase family protein [Deltaproteobacteria bacterium]|nr:MAG: glutathione S-transferase family protein [Deltaproteobacteria bacterium]